MRRSLSLTAGIFNWQKCSDLQPEVLNPIWMPIVEWFVILLSAPQQKNNVNWIGNCANVLDLEKTSQSRQMSKTKDEREEKYSITISTLHLRVYKKLRAKNNTRQFFSGGDVTHVAMPSGISPKSVERM